MNEQVRPPTTLRNSNVSASDVTVFLNWASPEQDVWWLYGGTVRSIVTSRERAEAVAWALARDATSYWICSADAADDVPLVVEG